MYIDSLDIIRETDDKVLRHIKFHMGTNIITDDQNLQTHNGAGKTTALRLLDVALGSKQKYLLYKDAETGNINGKLQNIIEESRIKIFCRISTKLPAIDKEAEVHTLMVELFKGGKKSIDGIPCAQNEYLRRLNELIFQNKDTKPSFRQLISPFLRISMKGDDDAFLHCLDPHARNIEYHGLYDYLFGIPNHQINCLFQEANDNLRAVKSARNKYRSVSGISNQNSEELSQLLLADQDEVSRLQERLNDIMKPEDFRENRDRIGEVRDAYEKANKELSDIQYKIRLNEESIKHAILERDDAPDQAVMMRFYHEIHELQPSIRKTFNDLIAFNRQLGENEINYFKGVGEQLYAKEKEIFARRADIVENNTRFLALLSRSDVSEYEDLLTQLNMIQKRIGERQEILDTTTQFDEEYEKAKRSVDTLQETLTNNKETPQKIVRSFTNNYFKPLAEKINGEKPVLTYNSEATGFPLAISDLSNGTSTGKRKSLIIAYDFAYQKFAARKQKPTPRFVVHDVLENIEEEALKKAVKIANESKFQYITAMLHSKLESAGFTNQQLKDMVILTLSEDDRLFKDN